MSRRDTIIIALLVNVSLLALLFLLAINTEEEDVSDQPDMVKTIVESRDIVPAVASPAAISLADTHVDDEVDNFLNDLAKEDSSQPIVFDDDGFVTLTPEPSVVIKPVVVENLPAEQNVKYVEITVKRGDALEKIARNNGSTVEAIKKANHLTSSSLFVGQVLRIPISQDQSKSSNSVAIAPPPPSQATKPKLPPPPPSSSVVPQYYIVKKGDNPWKIAKQFNVKFEDLLKMNNLDEERARNIKIGDKIRVK